MQNADDMLAKLCMVLSLLWTFAWATTRVLIDIPYRLVSSALPRKDTFNGAVFYEGEVMHERRAPVHNAFKCAAALDAACACASSS